MAESTARRTEPRRFGRQFIFRSFIRCGEATCGLYRRGDHGPKGARRETF